jgi:hypothetical protein
MLGVIGAGSSSGKAKRSQTVAKKKPLLREAKRPERAKLTPEESLKRMQEFSKRKEAFVAAIRKSKDRGIPS